MNPTPRSRWALSAVVLCAIAAVMASVATVVALNDARQAFETEHTRPLAVGDCVVVDAGPPDQVQARRSSCGEDPSYTVGALATSTGECPSAEYQHFPGPAADRATASLCLVPNLVADHCYRLGMPIGVVEKANCAERSAGSGVLVQVKQRLDVRDRGACPSSAGQYAWPYPSPARTYCTATVF
ncbi:hypothetical protein [Mycobacterium sp. ACS4331]|uniref:hypothetical protein n=1 Tax=Mycobacterium sp. ACS4331 TaxID=1834121 RepID=UPI0007FB7D4D|nr:hypothetical protein [Mycobacterium sp. ACS4331]OBF25405.1 hypothetical protein A5727_04535 [Mycobacterium sp. ACS4331]